MCENVYLLQQMRGTAAHETMHSLGVDHTQTRYDRNTYIQIDESNLDPQDIDYFEPGDVATMSGYGVEYGKRATTTYATSIQWQMMAADYFSVMHYNGYVAALDADKPTMKALKEPVDFFTEVLGQRKGLSDKDGELLRKMYCSGGKTH